MQCCLSILLQLQVVAASCFFASTLLQVGKIYKDAKKYIPHVSLRCLAFNKLTNFFFQSNIFDTDAVLIPFNVQNSHWILLVNWHVV